MSDRDTISLALCGFEPDGPEVERCRIDAKQIISMTLEKALHEAELLRIATDGCDDTLTAGSLWARLKALDAFIEEHMDVEFRGEANGAEQAESEAQS
jgi:hypothetical protein